MDPSGPSQPSSSGALPPPPAIVPANPERLPPPPAIVPANPERLPIARRGFGRKGQKVLLLTNHFEVSMRLTEGFFFHYSVAMSYQEDGHPVVGKDIGRKVIDKVQETYAPSLKGKNFVYDGEKSLFTVGPLPQRRYDFTVVLDDVSSISVGGSGSPQGGTGKRMKRQNQSKTIKVVINFAAKIPVRSITAAMDGQETEHFQEAVRVLDTILRQNAAKKGCLLVRQSFFHSDQGNFTQIGGGVLGCRGFHSSFRTIQGGLSLNIDVSTTTIIQPGPVIQFLVSNQNVKGPREIDWNKAKRTLKNLRIKISPSNKVCKITGLSERSCREQTFLLKQKIGDTQVHITVYDYFVHHRNIQVHVSADFPCINVGKTNRPTYIPIEFCELVSLQRYTKALSGQQRASLVEKSRQKPQERMRALSDALAVSDYNADPVLQSAGISISSEFAKVQGRILPPPKLLVGNDESFVPRNGRWNFNNKKLKNPSKIEDWAVVNFSARCDTRFLCDTLRKCGNMKGVQVSPPLHVFEENQRFRRHPPLERVNEMFKLMESVLSKAPKFILCILPERKNSDIYGPWKKRSLSVVGIVTQCISPTKVNDQYMTNVLLKINAKLGGLNSVLTIEHNKVPSPATSYPTIIFGMDVSHGSPGRSDIPSIAAVVGSTHWPSLSRYRASVRTQSPKTEMIASLFKPASDKADEGTIRELLLEFYSTSGKKPAQIIIFRDGVSESQFSQVLNIELDQIMKACNFLDEEWHPKFLLVVAQKNHHTKFFQAGSPDNVQPGTVIDSQVCHPNRNDFYLCAHAGMIGTTRPTHYHVIYDELNLSADDVQELVHSLSYVYQRSTTAVSVVAPICYAHLAAAQMAQFIKLDEMSESASSHGGVTPAGEVQVPELPQLHRNVRSSMFFC